MITRNILNSENEIIGELQFPDGTSEETISAKLAPYAAPIPVIIPDVTPRQIRQALILSGVSMQQIDDALDLLPEPYKSLAHVEWEYSIAFKRANPLVAQVGVAVGWTSEQLDALWHFAYNL